MLNLKSFFYSYLFIIVIFSSITNSLGYSNFSNQTGSVIEQTYKNKTIIINNTDENKLFVMIDGKRIDIIKDNSTFYTPLLPYQSYSSPLEISKDIIDLLLLNSTKR
jgi:hypothetical protein